MSTTQLQTARKKSTVQFTQNPNIQNVACIAAAVILLPALHRFAKVRTPCATRSLPQPGQFPKERNSTSARASADQQTSQHCHALWNELPCAHKRLLGAHWDFTAKTNNGIIRAENFRVFPLDSSETELWSPFTSDALLPWGQWTGRHKQSLLWGLLNFSNIYPWNPWLQSKYKFHQPQLAPLTILQDLMLFPL